MTYRAGYNDGYQTSLHTVIGGATLITIGGMMTLQDLLRSEQTEVSDTGSLLAQAADQIDLLEAAAADPIRLAALETAISDIGAILAALSS